MDIEAFSKKIKESSSGKALEDLTRSETGQRLARTVDGKALEEAAAKGDTKALAGILHSILSTPEGEQFARQVKKAVQDHGR